MSESTSVCEPWATPEDLPEACADIDDPAIIADAIQAASDVLFVLSGSQFPGLCEDVVRPEHPCGRPKPCGHIFDEIRLGVSPIVEVTQITIGADTVDPAEYRIDDDKKLIRKPLDGRRQTWPTYQRMDREAGEADTFEVQFIYGRPPPPAGTMAAAALACELAKARTGGKCALPRRVTNVTRQGVSFVVLDPFDFLESGKTGVYEVDLFLRTYNPSGGRRRATVASPDIPGVVRRTGTDLAGS